MRLKTEERKKLRLCVFPTKLRNIKKRTQIFHKHLCNSCNLWEIIYKQHSITKQKSPTVSASFSQVSSALPDNTPDSDAYPEIPTKDKQADFYS